MSELQSICNDMQRMINTLGYEPDTIFVASDLWTALRSATAVAHDAFQFRGATKNIEIERDRRAPPGTMYARGGAPEPPEWDPSHREIL